MVGGSHGAQVKLSDGSVKTVTAAGHLSKPGTTTLRMTGGVITAASSTPSSAGAASAAANQQQASLAMLVLKETNPEPVPCHIKKYIIRYVIFKCSRLLNWLNLQNQI